VENELRDIKPLLEIPDSSYYIFIALLVMVGVVLIALGVFLVKKFWTNRKINIKKLYLKELKELDWSETKKSAYTLTELGRELATEERSKEIYGQILPMLEQYKYRKEVPSLDEETLKQYELLVHVLDESI
jgi:hypothetical protein